MLPDTVSVSVAELAGELEEGLLAFCVGAGLKVVQTMMEHEVETLAGPKGRHDPDRVAVRHGSDDGVVTSAGANSGSPVPGCAARTAPPRCLSPPTTASARPSCSGAWRWRRCSPRSRPAATGPGSNRSAPPSRQSRGTSRSAVSRRFVAATETALAELMAADLTGLDLVALMVDGVNFAGHCCVVAVGIDIDGVKHPLGVVEGDTENATLVTDLLVGFRDRGLDVTRPILCVLDGAKALKSAVKAVFDHPVIARCQLHKIRNVKRHLPDKVARVVEKRMRAAYRNPDPSPARVTSRPSPKSSTTPTPARQGACARGWQRPSPWHACGSRRRLRARCGRPTRGVDDRDLSGPLGQCQALGVGHHGAAVVRGRSRARRRSSSAVSTVTCTCAPYALRSTSTLRVAVTPPVYTAEQEVAA